MERQYFWGLGAFALLVTGIAVFPHRTADPAKAAEHRQAAAHLKLASLSISARHDVDYATLDARLKKLVNRPSMVGLSVGVIENGRITFLAGYGETEHGSGDPVTPETVFRWASCSKGVAGTMAAKLAEQGKLDLNAPIGSYGGSLRLPNGNEHRATVTDLLSHRLGIYRDAYDNKLEEGASPYVLRASLGQLSAVCQPGTCWNYENVAFDASSELVAHQMGMPYPRAVKRTLFDPIGMTSASVTRDGIMGAKSWAKPHNAGRKTLELLDTYYKVPGAAGVNSNIKDMALWAIAQAGGMPDVLSPKLLDTIHAPLVRTPVELSRMRKFLERLKDPYYGLGWRSYTYAGHRIVGHRGGVRGYRSLILFDPALKSGVVALWNSDTNQPGGLEFEVMDMIYHLPFRDWLEIDKSGAPTPVVAQSEDEASGSPG